LADGLRRFLDDEPIRVRPVRRMERATKWVKRNPLVTALVVLSVLSGASGVFGLVGRGEKGSQDYLACRLPNVTCVTFLSRAAR
jgi:hypothetical protein